ncbi:hypothetical protein RI196_17295 [Aeribacillus composti]|uniref:Uncharacterized protein n=1 Tax=Aeribacillus composti TaxID=1868734 RepID=A0ABY9WAF4_9BACI|nr:hypothetical protein [Aeribacillus composti]WNF32953.1 hypothetical protein RI196_17295 [Aeribacillus composti]
MKKFDWLETRVCRHYYVLVFHPKEAKRQRHVTRETARSASSKIKGFSPNAE